jgi:hypothetical protein
VANWIVAMCSAIPKVAAIARTDAFAEEENPVSKLQF